MNLDLLAGAARPAPPVTMRQPTILLLDSGLGGLTVFAEVRKVRPDARFVYVADDAAFPYGALPEDLVLSRVVGLVDGLVRRHAPDMVVIACNTISTVVLPHLRHRFDIPFVGTVPAIKPAAVASRSRLISVLATPGTVARDYTRGLVEAYAGDCRVELVGSRTLAPLAEAAMRGDPVPDEAIADAIAPCFVADGGRRTDVIALACTHYPLLLDRLERLAPWPVLWIDPAPAIARRVTQILGDPPRAAVASPVDDPAAFFTGGGILDGALRRVLATRGLPLAFVDPHPLALREH